MSAATVVCRRPRVCGVRVHRVGTEAARACSKPATNAPRRALAALVASSVATGADDARRGPVHVEDHPLGDIGDLREPLAPTPRPTVPDVVADDGWDPAQGPHPTGGYDEVRIEAGRYASGARFVSYRRAGLLHRLDGPAEVHVAADERVVAAQWWQVGDDGFSRLHRTDGGPADVVWGSAAAAYHEAWVRDGMPWSDDGLPVVVERDVRELKFHYRGTTDTPEGDPDSALVVRDRDGALRQVSRSRSWVQAHPDDVPTTAKFTASGVLHQERWANDDNRPHRLDGPAVVDYHPENGEVMGREYWADGFELRGMGRLRAAGLDERSAIAAARHGLRTLSAARLVGDGADPELMAEAEQAGLTRKVDLQRVAGGEPVEWVAGYRG